MAWMHQRGSAAYLLLASAFALSAGFAAAPAHAAAGPRCRVIGDSVAVGLAGAMRGCSAAAKVGVSSTRSAAGARADGSWIIASIGSNDFPRGITPAQQVQSEARVRAALAGAHARAGSRLILILPANGARPTVAGWAAAHGVPTVAFQPGHDGIHPASYPTLAARVRSLLGD